MKKKIVTKATNVKNWIKREYLALSVMICGMLAPGNVASANNPPTAEDKWDAVIGFITPWITRLGGVVILIGAIEFGLAFKSDDAEGKTKGMRTVIAGCIVFAIGMSSDIFLV
ncbi:MAG: hypothetical protein IJE43_24110 [Alphaproteobacteria bacterium]|nr:hypothetical protein [Alphaproteobacteria bacterium]